MNRLIDKIAYFFVERPSWVKFLERIGIFLLVLTVSVFLVSYVYLIIETMGWVSTGAYYALLYLVSKLSFTILLAIFFGKELGKLYR